MDDNKIHLRLGEGFRFTFCGKALNRPTRVLQVGAKVWPTLPANVKCSSCARGAAQPVLDVPDTTVVDVEAVAS